MSDAFSDCYDNEKGFGKNNIRDCYQHQASYDHIPEVCSHCAGTGFRQLVKSLDEVVNLEYCSNCHGEGII